MARKRVAGVLCSVVAGVVLAGCSDGGSSGPDRIDDRAEFTNRAAKLCADIVDRRAANPEYKADRSAILDALAATLRKEAPAAETTRSLGRVADEFERTADELTRIEPADPELAAAWKQVGEAMRHDAQTYRDRNAAFGSGDPAAVNAAFTTHRPTADLKEPLTTLGLVDRDCRLLLN